MNKSGKLGFISYNGKIEVIVAAERGCCTTSRRLSDIGNSEVNWRAPYRCPSLPARCALRSRSLHMRCTIDNDISIAVRADGSQVDLVGCGILHVAQSRTAGNALLISSISS